LMDPNFSIRIYMVVVDYAAKFVFQVVDFWC
jgi:hypothetical protein